MSAPRQGGLATRPQETAATAAAETETHRGRRGTTPTAESHEANHPKAGPIPAPRQQAGSSGQPLPAALRDRLAPIVGLPAAQAARVHTGPAAQSWALQKQARAVADGTDIYFAEGEYRPGTRAGDVLIAHELAHVSQALRGLLDRSARWATVGAQRNAMEADADTAARQVTGEQAGEEHPQITRRTPRWLLSLHRLRRWPRPPPHRRRIRRRPPTPPQPTGAPGKPPARRRPLRRRPRPLRASATQPHRPSLPRSMTPLRRSRRRPTRQRPGPRRCHPTCPSCRIRRPRCRPPSSTASGERETAGDRDGLVDRDRTEADRKRRQCRDGRHGAAGREQRAGRPRRS